MRWPLIGKNAVWAGGKWPPEGNLPGGFLPSFSSTELSRVLSSQPKADSAVLIPQAGFLGCVSSARWPKGKGLLGPLTPGTEVSSDRLLQSSAQPCGGDGDLMLTTQLSAVWYNPRLITVNFF